MKLLQHSFFLVLLMLFQNEMAPCQQNFNLPLLANWDDDAIPPAWTGAYNSCWGYAANGKEYAVLASTQGTYFFNITDPVNPQLIDFIRTKDTTTLVVNKDYATYSHYLYAVSDQGDNSLQIFDLQYLPDSVVLAYDSNVLSKRCHTITIEHDRLYMCSNTRPNNTFGSMDVFSLANPLNPVLTGTLSNPGFSSVHEVFVRNDTAYCSNGYNGLWVYDMRLPATPSLIAVIDVYPENGYNHSSWLTGDGKTIAFTDENHGSGVKLMDLSDIHDAQFLSLLRSNMLLVTDSLTGNGSVAHIPYIVGNVLLVAYYHEGVVAYDISHPSLPEKIASYDTYPQNTDYYSYNGCWGLYPFLPSGNIIASDITNGLFILDGKNMLNSPVEIPVSTSFTLAGNPVSEHLEVLINASENMQTSVLLFDFTGKIVMKKSFPVNQGSSSIKIPVSHLSAGVYVACVQTDELQMTSRFIKINP